MAKQSYLFRRRRAHYLGRLSLICLGFLKNTEGVSFDDSTTASVRFYYFN